MSRAVAHQLAVGRQPLAAVQHHARRLAARVARQAHGQLRIVGQDGLDADQHGVVGGAQAVHLPRATSAR